MNKTKKTAVFFFGLLLASFVLGTSLRAEEAKPCQDDVAKFCKDVKPGGGAIMKCLKEHEKDLSEGCKNRGQGMKGKAKGKNPCYADTQKFCKDIKPGGGAIMKCLKEHEKDLSEGCKNRGQGMKENRQEFKEACKADLDKLCKDVKPGKGALIKCLKDHDKDLSGGCKTRLAEGRKKMENGWHGYKKDSGDSKTPETKAPETK